ncbi:MAG: hypothetical protein R8M45_03355, partial [Ghiorsea sp.]
MNKELKKHLVSIGAFKMDCGITQHTTFQQEKARFGMKDEKTLAERDKEAREKQKADITRRLEKAGDKLHDVADQLKEEYILLGAFIKSEVERIYSEHRYSAESESDAITEKIVNELGAADDLFEAAYKLKE